MNTVFVGPSVIYWRKCVCNPRRLLTENGLLYEGRVGRTRVPVLPDASLLSEDLTH